MSADPISKQPHGDHHSEEVKETVFTTQPGGSPSVDIGPSFQLLAQTDQIMMKRQISWLKCFTGCDTNAEYEITDMAGQRLFTAKEESDWFSRNLFFGSRGFKIKVMDNSNNELMRISRHVKAMQGMCCSGMPDLCGHEVLIQSPAHEMAGYVHQTGSCCRPSYNVLDPYDRELLNVKGPCCVFYGICAFCRQQFEVNSPSTTLPSGGMITKVWSGVCKELFSDAKDFQIDFPPGLDVKARAGIVGSAILVDFMLWYNRRICGPMFASWAAF